MPQIKDRAYVDERMTFDYSTPNYDVVARPTDPYVQPEQSSANQLVNSLAALQQGLGALGQYRQIKNVEDKQEGALSRAKGEIPKEKKTNAFIEGWETLDGELRAKQSYQQEVNEYFANNSELPQDEFYAGLEAISKKYTDGATKNFLKGFIESALDTETRTKDAYNKYQIAKVQEEKVTRTNSLINTDVTDMILKATQKLVPGSYTLDDIKTDPKIAQVFYGKQKEIAAELAPQFRKYLDAKMAQFKALGLSKKDISNLMLANVGDIAETIGVSGFLDYTDIKDNTGISVADTDLKDAISTIRKSAENAQDSILSDLDKIDKQQRKVRFSTKVNEFSAQLFALNPSKNPKDKTQADKLFKLIRNDADIMLSEDTGTVRALLNLAQDKAQFEPTSPEDDKIYLTPIYEKYWRGTLKVADLLNVLGKVSSSGQSKLNTFFKDLTDGSDSLKMDQKDSKIYQEIMKGVNSNFTLKQTGYNNPMFLSDISTSVLEKYLAIKVNKGEVTTEDWKTITDYVEQLLNPLPKLQPNLSSMLKETGGTSTSSTKQTSTSTGKTTKKVVFDPATGQLVEVK